MATTSTAIEPVPVVLPYRTLSSVPQADSPFPLGEMRFSSTGESITAAAGGNDQRANFKALLPRNYAYALIECNFSMTSLEIGDWTQFVECFWSNTTVNPVRNFSPFLLDSKGATFGLGAIWQPNDIPNGVIQVPASNAGFTHMQATFLNPVIDGTESFLGFNIRVLYYAIGQANTTIVNTPSLTR